MKWSLWNPKADKSDPNSTVKLAERASREENPSKAFELWRSLAIQGNPEAAFELAKRYERGDGALQNFIEATSWYKRAAEGSHLEAISRLGEIYFTGRVAPLTVHGRFSDKGEAQSVGGFAALVATNGAVPVDYGEASVWNTRAAERGDIAAQVRIAYQHAGGLGVPVDFGKAEHWFGKAAATGDPIGQFGMGLLHAGGNGRNKDAEKAETWLERAANQGHAAAKVCLAVLITSAEREKKDYARAADHLKGAAEAQHREGMFLYGEYRRFGIGCTTDESEAETWLRRAAIKGHLGAMNSVAALLRSQQNPDYASAAAFYRDAADLGDGSAQFALGEMYVAGHGVPTDPEQAAYWFGKAADQGVVAAYQRLGAMYADGLGMEQDFKAAASWFSRAAESGQSTANYDIAALHHYGLGVPHDPEKAIEFYRRAHNDNDVRATLRLGILHSEGELVEQDFAKASAFYRLAAERGDTNAKLNLAFLAIRGLGGSGPSERGISSMIDLAETGNLNALWSLYKLYSEDVYIPKNADTADHWLIKAGEAGAPAAALELGRRLQTDSSPPLPTPEILKVLSRSAKEGHAGAQSMLGRMLFEGTHVDQDAGAALLWLTRAANQGDTFAQAWLGDVLSTGQGVLVDRKAAAGWYLSAAKQGHPGALQALTKLTGGSAPDSPEQKSVFDLWLKLADDGDALAQRMVGDFYVRGIGCSPSFEHAAIWLRRSSDNSNMAASVILAGILLQGKAPALDRDEPSRLLHQAAGDGNADAEYNLGVCYKIGLGVAQNLDTARFWYRAAADHGHPSAQLALGDLLIEAQHNYPEALRLYTAAAAAGVPGAVFGLGRIHEDGLGVPKNKALAFSFYKRAATAGIDAARAALTRTSPTQVKAKL